VSLWETSAELAAEELRTFIYLLFARQIMRAALRITGSGFLGSALSLDAPTLPDVREEFHEPSLRLLARFYYPLLMHQLGSELTNVASVRIMRKVNTPASCSAGAGRHDGQ
jgi:hypothetical protein